MAIYTKRGDKGKTSLYDPQGVQNVRIDKDSMVVEVIGNIDELNSYLGVVKSETPDKWMKKEIGEAQKNLLIIGSTLAGSKLRFSKSKVNKLEKVIDKLEGELPVLKNFVLPGGVPISSHLQYARSLARRAERKVVSLSKLHATSYALLSYLNRLSDYLFILARKANFDEGIKEEVWRSKR